MKISSKQKIIIGTLIAIILGMCVGYAALSQILNINGTSKIVGDFNIQFTKIDEDTMTNATTVTKGGIGTTTANFTVDLEKPGSSAIYDLIVENKGSIDAVLKSIEGLDESNNKEPVDIVYSIIGINEGDPLNAGDSKSFQVKVIWNSSATSIPSTSKTLTLKLNYEQKTGTTIIATPESCFTTSGETITGYTCEDTDIIIPNTINGTTITEIGSNVFENKGLTSVAIPNGITTIGNAAFASNQLTNVIIPDSVTTLGGRAFGENQLVDVKISNKLTTIEMLTFWNNQITNITIPDSVISIGSRAFERNQLTNVVIPDYVTNIGDYAFEVNPLETVLLGKEVQTIGTFVFRTTDSADDAHFKIINTSGRIFNWYSITGQGEGVPAAATGTYGNVTVTAE